VTRTTTAVLFFLCAGTIGQAATEQEILDDFVGRLKQSMGSAQGERVICDLRLTSALQAASDKQALATAIAQKQLGAELAAAAAELAAGGAEPGQARSQFTQAVSQGCNQYQQAMGAAYNEWSQDCSAAYGRAQQDAGGTLSAAQQAVSAAQQGAMQALQGPDMPAMPPIVEARLPNLMPDPARSEAVAAGVQKAVAEARQRYLADVAAALAEGDKELDAAVAHDAAADRAAAIRQAINKLRAICLDRHDQYEAEVRSAVRKALLESPD
jgi:hypothetical protein